VEDRSKINGRRWRPVLLTFRAIGYPGTVMHCFVYASQRKADTFLWLAQRDNFEVLPATLVMMLGDLRFVLEVELQPERRLPRENVEAVLENLRTQGWYLQLPPQETVVSAGDPSLVPKRQHE
jgi:uncharacterized protein YcgL (UPF0745 family)